MSFKVIQLILFVTFISYAKSDQVADLEKKFNYQLELLKTHFETEITQLNKKIETQTNNNTNNQTTCEKDWISYSDTKCYKILSKKGSEVEAKANCSQLDSSSTLITIESKEEQLFLSNHLKDYKNISVFVWIGLEYVEKTFKWVDGNGLKYENWGENAVKDGNNKCVQMSLADNELGKWTDDSCLKKFQFVCQKKQSTKAVLSQEVKELTKLVGKLQQDSVKQQEQIEELNNKNQTVVPLIPIGFLYTQLPNQSSPQQLWSDMEWTEVTQQYAGLFFRAEGGASEKFGTVQAANYSRITGVKSQSCGLPGTQYQCYEKEQFKIEEGKWTSSFINANTMFNHELSYFITKAENRPRNTAIKIWKRTK